MVAGLLRGIISFLQAYPLAQEYCLETHFCQSKSIKWMEKAPSRQNQHQLQSAVIALVTSNGNDAVHLVKSMESIEMKHILYSSLHSSKSSNTRYFIINEHHKHNQHNMEHSFSENQNDQARANTCTFQEVPW